MKQASWTILPTVIMAFAFGGAPIFVMPLVFGGAPVVNAFLTISMTGKMKKVGPVFLAGLMMVFKGWLRRRDEIERQAGR